MGPNLLANNDDGRICDGEFGDIRDFYLTCNNLIHSTFIFFLFCFFRLKTLVIVRPRFNTIIEDR